MPLPVVQPSEASQNNPAGIAQSFQLSGFIKFTSDEFSKIPSAPDFLYATLLPGEPVTGARYGLVRIKEDGKSLDFSVIVVMQCVKVMTVNRCEELSPETLKRMPGAPKTSEEFARMLVRRYRNSRPMTLDEVNEGALCLMLFSREPAAYA